MILFYATNQQIIIRRRVWWTRIYVQLLFKENELGDLISGDLFLWRIPFGITTTHMWRDHLIRHYRQHVLWHCGMPSENCTCSNKGHDATQGAIFAPYMPVRTDKSHSDVFQERIVRCFCKLILITYSVFYLMSNLKLAWGGGVRGGSLNPPRYFWSYNFTPWPIAKRFCTTVPR